MFLILSILSRILDVYTWVIIIGAILSWLIAFQVINTQNDAARAIIGLIAKVTEPIYVYIRKVIPPIGGLDLSPLILLLGIWLIQTAVIEPLMVQTFAY